VLLWVSPAVARAAMESGVARRQIDIDAYADELFKRLGRGTQFRNEVINRALESEIKRVVYPEGTEATIIRAAYQAAEDGLALPVLLGNEGVITQQMQELGLAFTPTIIDPATSPKREVYAEALYKLRKRKGMTLGLAEKTLRDPITFGMMMVNMGDADAFLGGVTSEYPEVLRPALQIVGTKEGVQHAAGLYIMIANRRVYLFADCTVNIDPTAETLADIAVLAADFAVKELGLEPRVAMLSFSNFGSAPHAFSNKVREAVKLVKARRPDLVIDGEMQADTAVTEAILQQRFPFSRVHDANVLIFPDLGSANISYKLLARLGGAEVIGPVLLGMAAPVQVLQAGDDVEEIVAMTAIATTDYARTPVTEQG
jgi:malate dehydrogenase (oxaloacetate-decarboxylating)(NADP+)